MKLKLEFVTDLIDGWSALNLVALQQAIADLGALEVELELRPFELHADLPPEGVPVAEHIARTYGADMAAAMGTRDALGAWANELGFDGYKPELRQKYHNSFDGHRLLRWAWAMGGPAAQARLAQELQRLTLCEGGDVSCHGELLAKVEAAGLDVAMAKAVLQGPAFADEVCSIEREYRAQGLETIPALFVGGKLVCQGSQSSEVYTTLIRQAATPH